MELLVRHLPGDFSGLLAGTGPSIPSMDESAARTKALNHGCGLSDRVLCLCEHSSRLAASDGIGPHERPNPQPDLASVGGSMGRSFDADGFGIGRASHPCDLLRFPEPPQNR